MQTETAKKIYAQETTANMIAGKLAKRNPDQKFTVVKVTTGWQVCPVNVAKPAMPVEKPAPVKKMEKMAPEAGPTLTYQLVTDAPKSFVVVGAGDGDLKYLHKSSVLWASEPENGMIQIQVTGKYAAKMPVEDWCYEADKVAEMTLELVKDRKSELVVKIGDEEKKLAKKLLLWHAVNAEGKVVVRALAGVFKLIGA